METKKYEIKGKYLKNGKEISFSTKTKANNEKNAKEKVLANIGSRHKVKRNRIRIETIQEMEE